MMSPHQSDGDRFSFEWFSGLAAYRDANRAQLEAFLSGLRLAPPWQGVDVACGVGLMAELTHVIGARIGGFIQRTACVDLDLDAIKIARQLLGPSRADFLQAVGQRLPLRDGFGSFLTIGNGIHNFGQDDKASLFAEAYRILKGGGALFFNSAFYEGAVVPGTERFYTDKIRRAMRVVGRERGGAGQGEHPEATRPVAPHDYVELAERAGFTGVQHHEVEVRLHQELWEAISSYGAYARGALHFRYSVEESVGALVGAVRGIFSDPEWDARFPGMTDGAGRFIPRRWLWVTAYKPA